MKLRHRIAGWLLPELKNLAYTSAGQGRRSQSWIAPATGPNNSLTGNLGTLINRSRAAIRNDPWAASGLEKLVANIVGTGIKPKSEAKDDVFRKELQALFLDWTDESDADGQLDFYGQQALAMRSVLEAGECFVRFRPRKPGDGLSVPLQLQLLEAEFVPWDYNDDLKKGHKIRAGIEFNAIGQRVAYWMHKQHPSDYTTLDTADLRRVPADQVMHLYEPLRPGQLRGQPLLSQVLLRMYHLDKFDDATLLRQEIANLFTGFITKPAPETEKVDPLTGRPIVYDLQGVPMVAMEPGTMQELSPGEEITFNTPPGAASNYPDFIRQQLMAVSAGIGLPYEILSGDMKGVSDRALRVVLNEFRRRIQQIQHNLLVFQLCRPVWKRWLELAVLSGAISAPDFHRNPTHYRKVKWIPQGWAYIHPVQDVQSQNLAVRSGFKSRSEVVSEQGYDSEQIDDEIAADNQRADGLELQYDSDARTQETNNTFMEEEPENDEQKAAQ
ncbi:phage portal protein [Endozoicomonas numazuensis]|uniref:Portal protein n=1 Tax=Endozoicomonas numazuensis TaxID=1137799 RepID=A0A081NI13_9GAMM|nr:phage portal protein [Endozoicomonas numazuensis]KEQ18086.1 portal protein [Endozoicomonas numazuensis]